MKKYISQYVNKLEKELNVPLMNKEYDRPLVEYIVDCFKSLEILNGIEIIDWKYEDDESKVDINDFIMRRNKKKGNKDKKKRKLKFIKDDRYGCLTLTIRLTGKDTKGKNELVQQTIKTKILIPIQDKDGYFFLKGKKYFLLYQITEKSTYTTRNGITLKSLMPISLQRTIIEKDDIDGYKHKLPCYSVFVFKKAINVLLFYAAYGGLTYALSFLDMDNAIRITDYIENNSENIYFKIKNSMYLEVNRGLFNNYVYVQAICGMLLDSMDSKFTNENFDNREYWIRKLGYNKNVAAKKQITNNNSFEKGRDILIFFNRMLDETIRKALLLDEYNKKDIFSLLRWMMQNYNNLRKKNNMDLCTKRLRCNEYIASLLTLEFSKKLNRIITLGNKCTIDNYKEIFKIQGDILLQKMNSSGILKYDDTINDMDFFVKFKYTKLLLV